MLSSSRGLQPRVGGAQVAGLMVGKFVNMNLLINQHNKKLPRLGGSVCAKFLRFSRSPNTHLRGAEFGIGRN